MKRIIIPDRLYHKIWNTALEHENFELFYSEITNSSLKNKLIDVGIDYDKLYDLLKMTFTLTHSPTAKLLEENGIKNSVISHQLCIPIKTIERWKSGYSNCPSYMNLIIVRTFNIPYLPANIYIESCVSSTSPNKEKKLRENNNSKKTTTNYPNNIVKTEVDVYNEKELSNYNYDRPWSLKEFEQTHVFHNSDALSSTDYLGDILKRRQNNDKKQ